MHRFPSWLLLALSIAAFLGCQQQNPTVVVDGAAILFSGTDKYQKVIGEWEVSPEQATQLVADWAKKNPETFEQRGFWEARHILLVGDCYLFSRPEILKVSLTGFYVDGHTGEVRFEEHHGTLAHQDFPQDRKNRFFSLR